MRVGFDISKALGPVDGIGRYTLELLRALAALEGDHELWLYPLLRAASEEALGEALGGWPERCRLRPGRWPEEDPIDLFHSTAWIHPPAPKVPILFTCYDLTFLTHPGCHTVGNKIHCATGLLRAHLLGAELLAISEATAGELRRLLGVPAERIHVVHPAAAPHFRPLPAEEARRRVGERFAVDEPFLLTVGTLEPRKNLRRLLEAYGRLPPELRRAHPLLVAGGRGWGSETLEEVIAGRRELATVRLLGAVGDDDLVALQSAATLFVYPSLAEGFGLPVLEAMTCGAPVLTADRPATTEVAADAARRVDPENVDAIARALAELLADPGERRRLRLRGLERAAAFSWRRAAAEILELYRRLTAQGPPP